MVFFGRLIFFLRLVSADLSIEYSWTIGNKVLICCAGYPALGTKEMWNDFSENLGAHEDARIQRECCMPIASREERVKLRKSMSMGFFKSKK